MGKPGADMRQRLGLEVNIQRRKIVPRRITAQEFRGTGKKAQPEQDPVQQKEDDG